MNSTQADQARWNKVWQFLRGLGCKLQLGTDNAEMAVNFIRELPNSKQGQSPQAGSEAVSAEFALLSGKLTRIAASLLKERLADFAEDYPKRFPKHVLRDIERHNERIRVLACELIDLKRAI